ncbi:MAG: biotin/lipoyl-binding carrier protein [Candidatus Dormibacteraeota bacterium]|nr:biotin/lipoyl-binding carrier protein [Candidatus Dormibacteraeota bacterium]
MQIKAELAGNVWKVLVKDGQRVAADETLLILESMKMEIPVNAPKAGTVTRLSVKEGDPVQEGQRLADLE